MTYRKRRFRGAISIFLVIILVSNYALVGLLVDSGRQRMARASAEMALDTAAASVLSYYDKMVYDLYGLFTTDSLSKEKIETLLSDYVQKTLVTTPIDPSEAKKLTDTVVSSIFGTDGKRVDSILFDGYDYQFNSPAVKFNEENSVSLAYTDAVEMQIIDHMKYRAPLSLAEETGSFLDDLRAILNVGDRIGQTIDKLTSSDADKKALSENANKLINDIERYNKKVFIFSSCGREALSSELPLTLDSLKGLFRSAYDPWEDIDRLDDKFNEIGNSVQTVFPDEENYEAWMEQEEAELREKYETAYQNFLNDWDGVGKIAERLYEEAVSLKNRADSLYDQCNAYKDKLQEKMDADPQNENLKTLYLPEIELAEAVCGEALKNISLVIASEPYTAQLRDAFQENSQAMGGFTDNFLQGAVERVIATRMGEDPERDAALLRTYIENGRDDPSKVFAQQANLLMGELSNSFDLLYKIADSYDSPNAAKLKTTTAPKADSITKKEAEKKENLRDLTKEDLAINFKNTSGKDKSWSCSLSDNMDTDNTVALLEAGNSLLKDIFDALNNARDSLYIDEYIISYFPNYVQHYNAPNSELGKKGEKLISSASYYAPFNASQAELEYILSGNPDASKSIFSVSAKLTAVRMVFNTIAIFTDAAKVSQANALAVAISGPFAPIVSVALLVAWALAESALDTSRLLDGEEVEVFKQGSNWKISVEGGIKTIVGKAADYVASEVDEAIEEKIGEAAGAVSTVANRTVYSAYQHVLNAAETGQAAASEAVGAAKSQLVGWSNTVTSAIKDSNIQSEFQSAANATLDSAFTVPDYSAAITDAKDKALLQVNEGIKKAEKELNQKAQEMTAHYGEQFTNWIGDGIASCFEVGNAVHTGDAESATASSINAVKMNYLDYMRIFLLFYGNEYKVKRIQELVQANIRYGMKNDESHKAFSMETAYTNISATMDTSIKYMFMSNALLPQSLKLDGRMKVSVLTDLSY